MSKELLNKAVASCFAKIARVDGSIGKEELDIINSSEILKKYGGSIEGIDTKDFFNSLSKFSLYIIEKIISVYCLNIP